MARGDITVHKNNQIITIKGTKDGLTLFIDDRSSFEAVLKELSTDFYSKESISKHHVSITVNTGNRYLSKEQEETIRSIVEGHTNLLVKNFKTNVLLKEEAKRLIKEKEMKIHHTIVRSGQVLEEVGDLLLIGDVNPGGLVRATGNIYVMGNLLGTAHAGSTGDSKAIIIASYMKPSQLRIADYISRSPDYESSGVYMECGLIDEKENRIILNRLQTLSQIELDLNGLERRMENG